MTKFALLGATALRTCFAVTAIGLTATTSWAQDAAAQGEEQCNPQSPNYDANTGNCPQPAETATTTAPGTNPGTAPGDEAAGSASSGESEAIVITGSRIPRPQFEGTIPGAQVTGEQIQSRAFNSAIEALNDIPLVGPGASPFGTNGGQPGSLGAAFVDLLDLGTNRTLTLVNGRRFVSGNQGTLFVAGNISGSQVDLNVIPTALISRFDVLTVGGAAAYGSDAIAGVVNAILRDDYDGIQVGGISGITEQGDAFNYRVTALAGKNFLDDRANVTVSYERVHDDGLMANKRKEYAANPIAPTFFGNGAVRNGAFTATIPAAVSPNGPFLPAGIDGVPNNVATEQGIFGGTVLLSPGGSVFSLPATISCGGVTQSTSTITQGPLTCATGTTLATGTPGVGTTVAGNAQLIPAVPVSATLAGCSVTNLATFCNFAPTGLPAGTSAQQAAFAQAVITQFAPALIADGTQAQRNALAVQLLQNNKRTPREFFAANPNLDPNLFFGTFLLNSRGGNAFLTIANTDPATSTILPRRAVPLFFNDSGNLVDVTTCIDPATPGTAGGAPCSNSFQNPANFTVLRTEQTRDIGNLFAHIDVTDNITLYTEMLYAEVDTISLQNTVPSSNSIANGTTENTPLIIDINNPFLDPADRATLVAAGVPATGGRFLLSRTNQDLAPGGKNPVTNFSDTIRLVGGVKGNIDALGMNHRFDASLTYGKNNSTFERLAIRDIEYALAVDAVTDGSGNIVCRVQVDRAGALGGGSLPRGIAGVEIIRVPGPDGILTEQLLVRQVSQSQIDNCEPFNPFGFAQSSEEARRYVTGTTRFENENKQLFAQASLAGSLVNLPGGPLGYALSADYRQDKIAFNVDKELSQGGFTRSAALANTEGKVDNVEFGVELRVPIFGEDFTIPVFQNLDFTPAVRWVKQTGKAPTVRLLNGTLQENEYDSDWNRIYSLAGSWRPIRDITLRGNITRSIRQPSIVELFLGGQPAFNAYTDPCTSTQIVGGLNPAVRRENCINAAITTLFSGIADPVAARAAAETFLAGYTNPGISVTGFFTGNPNLLPERGRSYTFGAAVNPRFVPGLKMAADYINVRLLDQIIPTTLTRALQVCFDSPNFPDTSGDVGVNTCTFFTRQGPSAGGNQFILDNNFRSGFINLGALQVEAVNATASYDVPISDWFNANLGKLELYANVYRLLHYRSSSNGDLKDERTTFDFVGDFTHPKWEVQGRARYEHPSGTYFQWVTNWQSKTCVIGVSDICATEEEYDALKIPAFAIHDATVGISFGENNRFNLQLAVSNVFDKKFGIAYPQALGLGAGGVLDTFGRRFRVSTNVKF